MLRVRAMVERSVTITVGSLANDVAMFSDESLSRSNLSCP